MLDRLFRSKTASRLADDRYTHSLLEPESWLPMPLCDTDICVLFCQDSGDLNKTVLFDSSHSAKDTVASQTTKAHSWHGLAAQVDPRANTKRGWPLSDTVPTSLHEQSSIHYRQSHDGASHQLDLMGDMIFGTAPLAHKGMNTKIHYKHDKDPQIVLSKLFMLQANDQSISRRTSFSSINSDRSTTSSIDESHKLRSTLSAQPPYSDADHGDNDPIAFSTYPAAIGLTSQSYSKRNQRFNLTNLENVSFRPTPMPCLPREFEVRASSSRPVKYAMVISFTVQEKNKVLHDFIFSHFALIENHLHQLQAIAMKQLCAIIRHQPSGCHLFQQQQQQQYQHQAFRKSKKNTPQVAHNALQENITLREAAQCFISAIIDLYKTPRLQEPLWLNMTTFPHRKSDYSAKLTRELIYLICNLDGKAHNYFFSTIVTSVLMYHLSWVHTVVPPDEIMHTNYHHGKYDPLWAQLSDLFGYVGTLARISRTIVVGQNTSIVRRLLYVLSYLIRCNEVYENHEVQTDHFSSIFSQQGELDESCAGKSNHCSPDVSIDVESIAIPNSTKSPRNFRPLPAESPDSFTARSSSTSLSTTSVYSARTSAPCPWTESICSSTNTTDNTGSIFANEVISAKEELIIPMPKSSIFHMEPDITQTKEKGVPTIKADQLYAKSYGRSMMASYCDSYRSDFALSGIPAHALSISRIESDMKSMLQQFALSDSVTDVACLVINTDTCECRVLHQHCDDDKKNKNRNKWDTMSRSKMVENLLFETKRKFDAGISPEELVDFFEDSLQVIYLKSTMLQEQLYTCTENGKEVSADNSQLTDNIGVDVSDIPLLVNVCSVYEDKIWTMMNSISQTETPPSVS